MMRSTLYSDFQHDVRLTEPLGPSTWMVTATNHGTGTVHRLDQAITELLSTILPRYLHLSCKGTTRRVHVDT